MYDPSALVDVSKSLTGTAETLTQATAAINRISVAIAGMVLTLRELNGLLERRRLIRRADAA